MRRMKSYVPDTPGRKAEEEGISANVLYTTTARQHETRHAGRANLRHQRVSIRLEIRGFPHFVPVSSAARVVDSLTQTLTQHTARARCRNNSTPHAAATPLWRPAAPTGQTSGITA